jgi:hypothetical protein
VVIAGLRVDGAAGNDVRKLERALKAGIGRFVLSLSRVVIIIGLIGEECCGISDSVSCGEAGWSFFRLL